MRRIALPTLVCAAFLAGCNFSLIPRGTEIETEPLFTMPPQAALQAPFTVANHGPGAVQVPTCGDRIGVIVERAEWNRWVQASGSACPAYLNSVPLTVEAGGRVEGAVPFGAGGTFRIRLHLMDGPEVMSRSFTVR